MNLIPISENILVNPDMISCVEQRVVKGIDVTYIWIGDKHYILGVPLDEFYKSLRLKEEGSEIKQYFAG